VLVDRLVEAFNGREILEISANRLTEDECKALVAIYDNYGLWGERAAKSVEEKIRFVRNTCHSEFSAILLATLNSPQILGRYNLILDDLQQRRGFHKVLVSILILTVLQYPATTDTLLDIWGEQILNPRFRQDSAVRQLCNVRSGLFIMRSSVAARYLLQNMGNSRVIVDVLVTMAKQCSRLSQSSKQYYELLRQLMLFSNLTTFTPPAERRSLIVSFYESVRTLPQTRTNPQFWLQYAIAALVFEDMDRAKVYFKDAYSYASKRDGYDTTYIDNQYARYLLSYVVQNHLEPNYMIIFREARDLLLPQMKGERLHYPYRVASSFADFYNTFESKFSSEEKQEIRNTATRVLESIASLPADKQTHKYVTRCYENMTYLTEMLSSPTS
jgi:DNA-binding transcriptional regulator GbsR (MarR family)